MAGEWLSLTVLLAAFVAVGAFTGLAAGLMRTGGGVLVAPATLYLLDGAGYGGEGMVAPSIATALAANTLLSARALVWHARHGSLDRGQLALWAAPLLAGGVAGGLFVTWAAPGWVLAVAAAALVAAGLALVGLSGRRAAPRPGLGVALMGGVPLGALSAASGAGGGTFGGAMLRLTGVAHHAGTGAGFGLLLGLAGAGALAFAGASSPLPLSVGAVNLPGALLIAVAASLAAPHGARIGMEGPAKAFQFALAFTMLATGFAMLRVAVSG